MKKTLLFYVGLPAAFLALGYGAGSYLSGSAPKALVATAEAVRVENLDPAEELMREMEAIQAERDRELQAKMKAKVKAKPLVSVETAAAMAAEAKAEAESQAANEEGEDGKRKERPLTIVSLGRMTIPVYKARSVTYVVTNLGVTVRDTETAGFYKIGKNAAELRDAILIAMKRAADGSDLRGVSIDTEKLAANITTEIKPGFSRIEDIVFISFYKKDVPRS